MGDIDYLCRQRLILAILLPSGTVIRNTGSHYIVRPDNPDNTLAEVPCRAKGSMRLRGLRTTNPVAVGDRVDYDTLPRPDGVQLITRVHPRSNYIIRRASNLSKECHILASNLDQAALVATLMHPQTPLAFIDRFLATAEAYSVHPLLIINKIDLLPTDDGRCPLLDEVSDIYRAIGYTVLPMSARTGEGLPAVLEHLQGRVTLLSGNSGVGKSTLVNALIPDACRVTASISEAHDQGTHTTTFSEMLTLPGGGAVIDTPGVRGFGTIDMAPAEVSHFFPDIFALGRDCRFANCSHTHEPGCAVLQALDQGLLSPSRYASYLSIIDDATQGKYR